MVRGKAVAVLEAGGCVQDLAVASASADSGSH